MLVTQWYHSVLVDYNGIDSAVGMTGSFTMVASKI